MTETASKFDGFHSQVSWLLKHVYEGSQAALAADAEVDDATVYRWVEGIVRRPHRRNRERIAELMVKRTGRARVAAALESLGGPDDDPSL